MSAFPLIPRGPFCLLDQSESAFTLDELNTGNQRYIDTFTFDHLSLIRDSRPFARLTRKKHRNTHVAIIGGGFAGFCAAYELQRAGVQKVTIFEGAGRLGGRADTREFTDKNGLPYYSEMGAMRVPRASKVFWHYLRLLQGGNPSMSLFPNPGVVPTRLIYRGHSFDWIGEKGPQDAHGIDWSIIREGWNRVLEALTVEFNGEALNLEHISKLLKKSGEYTPVEQAKLHAYWRTMLGRYEHLSFEGALQSIIGSLWGTEQYNMFSTLGLGTGGFGPIFPISFVEIVRLLLWNYSEELTPNLTMSETIERFHHMVKCQNPDNFKVIMQTVTYVGYAKEDPQKPVVISLKPRADASDNRLQADIFDYVISTVPIRSAQIRINIDSIAVPPEYQAYAVRPAFDGQANHTVREAIRVPNMISASKLFGFMETKPWNDTDIDWPYLKSASDVPEPIKCVLTDTLPRQMYFLDPYPENSKAGVNALISYNWGYDSVRNQGIMFYSPDQTLFADGDPDFNLKSAYQLAISSAQPDSPIAQSIDKITVDQSKDNLVSIFWQQEPLIFGAFKLDYPCQYEYNTQLYYQYQDVLSEDADVNKRIILAGNSVGFLGGWIEGALISAVNASAAVLCDITGGDSCEFRMQPLFESGSFASEIDAMVAERRA